MQLLKVYEMTRLCPDCKQSHKWKYIKENSAPEPKIGEDTFFCQKCWDISKSKKGPYVVKGVITDVQQINK